jgi:hypothetical protein
MKELLKHSQSYRFLFILLAATAFATVASAQTATLSVSPVSTQTGSEQQQTVAERFLDLIADGNYEEAC